MIEGELYENNNKPPNPLLQKSYLIISQIDN